MKSATKTIFVNPIERTSYQGRDRQIYTIHTGSSLIPTVRMGKAKEDGVTAQYKFPHDPLSGKIVTGLKKQVENPYYKLREDELMAMYNLPSKWLDRGLLSKIVQNDKISKQTLFEIKHGVDPDFYTDNVRWSIFNMPSDMSLWGDTSYLQQLTLILYPRPNKFDDSTPRQELLMEMVQVLPQVAKSKAEANSAFHDWYISEENEAEQEMAKKQEIIEEATYSLYKLKKEYGRFQAYQIAICLLDKHSRPLIKGVVNEEGVSNILSQFISIKNSDHMENIERFMKLYRLLETREGMDRLHVMYLLQQARNEHVIDYRDGQYIWHSKAGTPDIYNLGSAWEGLISFFMKEYVEYNPDSELTNWYKELLDEVSRKGTEIKKT